MNALRGGEACDAGVGAVVIVVMDPGGVGCCASVVGEVGAGEGPLGGEGAVEPFDLAVGLGPLGPGAAVLDPVAEGCGEVV